MDYSHFLKPIYQPGDVVNSANPYSYIIITSAKGRYCDNCANPVSTGSLVKCSLCDFDGYCGPECRQAAWAVHRFECPLLDAWRKRGKAAEQLLDKTRLLFRTLARRYFENKSKTCGGEAEVTAAHQFPDMDDPGWRLTFDELLSHAEDIQCREELYLPVLTNLDDFCEGAEKLEFERPSREETIAVFGRIRTNWVEVFDSKQKIIGEAVYISPSVVNHSCEANSFFVSYGLRLQWRALRTVDTRSEELTLNYDLFHEGFSTIAERKDFSTSLYFFECRCPLCDDSQAAKDRDRRLTSMRCVYGDECRKKAYCDYCAAGADASPEERQAAQSEVNRILEALTASEAKEDHRLTIETAARYLRESFALGVCNVSASRVRRKLVSACFELEDSWKAGVEAGAVLLDVYLLFHRFPSAPVGKLRFELGVMLARGGRWAAAREQFDGALAALSITHGADHEYVREIDRWLAAAAKATINVPEAAAAC